MIEVVEVVVDGGAVVGCVVTRLFDERPDGRSLWLNSMMPDKFDATYDWRSSRLESGCGVTGRENDVLVDVRQLECFGAASRALDSSGSFIDLLTVLSGVNPHPPVTNELAGRTSGPGRRPETDRLERVIVVAVCKVVAVEEDARDDVRV